MKLLSGILGLTLTSAVALASANAADLYRGPAGGGYKDGPYVPVATWAGFYAGVHVGGAWADLKVTDVDGYNVTPGRSFTNSVDGVFGGGTLGYNIQRGALVFGIEGDLGYMDLASTKVQPGSPGGDTKSKIDGGLYGDITGRLGYSFDRLLVYGKGGFGFYNGEAQVYDNCNTGTCGDALRQSGKTGTFTGWVAGGGVEYAYSPAWSLKVEYLHFDLDKEQVRFTTGGDRWDNNLTIDTVKAGLNYHLISGYEPLK